MDSCLFRRWSTRVCCALACFFGAVGIVEAGTPKLARLSPPGGQRGTLVEVHLIGKYMDNPEELLFYEPGLATESIELMEGEIETSGRKERIEQGTRLRARIKITDDCPLGPHGLRVRTANGISEYQRFFVGPFPTVEEEESTQKRNDKVENAKVIEQNVTVLGRMNDSADVDLYRLEVTRGQRISAEIESARLGTERGIPDLHLSVLDANGKPILAVDDSALFVQDPILSTVADRNGVYFVAVRHSIYNAASETYRLHVGNFVRPTGVFPAGGQLGEALTVRVLGDPRGVWTQSVRLPSDRPGEFGFVAVRDGMSAPSPNRMRVSPFPNAIEVEPNDSLDAVKEVSAASLPIAFNGIIEKPGDIDCFRFHASKGERFKVHALANAFGSPLDPTISIRPVNGKPGPAPFRATDSRPNQLGFPPAGGLNRDTLDPIIDFTAPADGDYVLTVEDDRGSGGIDFVYRVEMSPETDAVFTYIPLEPENQFTPQARQSINVPAGNRYNTSISIFNTNRPASGDLELVAIGLPEGLRMHAPRVTSTMTRVPVVFEAAANAKPAGKLIEIIARPVSDSDGQAFKPLESGFRQVVAMNAYGNNDYYLHTVIDRLAIAVTEPAPFTIEVEEPKSALVQNGEMTIPFAVRRAAGFDGPVTVSMEWRPSGVTAATPATNRSDKAEGEYLVGAAKNATAGTYQVTMTCVSGGDRPGYYDNANRTYVASKVFSLKIAEPHIDAKFARTSIERGKTAKLVVRLNHLKPIEGKAKATLMRLPRGVKLMDPLKEITAEDKEISFTLQATDEALVGNYQGITLELTVTEDGQPVRQLSGSGLLRIDAERTVAANQ